MSLCVQVCEILLMVAANVFLFAQHSFLSWEGRPKILQGTPFPHHCYDAGILPFPVTGTGPKLDQPDAPSLTWECGAERHKDLQRSEFCSGEVPVENLSR